MIGSLFSGIGGLELGLEWAGFGPVIWQVEQDPFCRAVLAKHWPNVDRSVTDVRLVTTSTLPRPRFLCGGFPCQDVSGAGKGAGLAGERSGLWFVFRDVIKHFRPEGVIVENVAGGKKRWLCQVRSDLHALGYRTRAVQISAANVGAPHLRERVFVLGLADAGSCGRKRSAATQAQELDSCGGHHRAVADAIGARWNERRRTRHERGGSGEPSDGRAMGDSDVTQGRRESERERSDERPAWQASPARPNNPDGGGVERCLGGVSHGLSAGLDGHRWPAPRGAEQYSWEPPRTVEGRKAFTPEERAARRNEHRRARLKALGNAVMPQCAYVAGLVFRDWIGGAS